MQVRTSVFCFASVLLVCCAGCNQSSDSPPAETSDNHLAIADQSAAGAESSSKSLAERDVKAGADAAPRLLSETWHAHFMQGQKIGYRHTAVRQIGPPARRLIQTKIIEHQSVLRFGQRVSMEIKLTQLADPAGKVVQFEYEVPLGTEHAHMRGAIHDGTLTLLPANGGAARNTRTVRLPAGTLGFTGLEESLAAEPLAVGRRRTISMLQLPPFPIVGKVELEAEEEELVQLPAGEVRLTRIAERLPLPDGQTLNGLLWIDSAGQILKYAVPQVQQETFLTTREQALATDAQPTLDLGNDTMVKLPQTPGDLHSAQRATYRFWWRGKSPPPADFSGFFARGVAQSVEVMPASGPGNALVTVVVVRPDEPEQPAVREPSPTEADRKPSGMIQSDDRKIVELATEATQGAVQTWAKAVAIEKFVHEYLTQKDYSQAFSSAAEVVHSRTGDCTEHAVLVAAMCRAAGVPARTAYGLVYVARDNALAFHMWNEVWTGDRWCAIDATLGQGGIGAGHVKFGASSLADTSALLSLLPVMQAVGNLSAEVVP